MSQAFLSFLCPSAPWALHPSKASTELQGIRLSLDQLQPGKLKKPILIRLEPSPHVLLSATSLLISYFPFGEWGE